MSPAVSSDYISVVSDLRFMPQGPSLACGRVPILDNQLPEKTKKFTVLAVTNSGNVLLDPIETTITILDDDSEFLAMKEVAQSNSSEFRIRSGGGT